mgnify:CR=1 FL=1|jgi:hypothetical protein
MDASSLPVWAQTAGTIAIAIVAAVIGVLRYIKTQPKDTASKDTATVVSASFLDSKLVKELIEALREHQEESGRDIKRILRSVQDLRDAVLENTEALVVQTDTSANMLRFITRLTRLENNHDKIS